MSDFLTTLLASHRGELRAIQPRIPARFESAPPNPLSGEERLAQENIEHEAPPPARPLPHAEHVTPHPQPTPYRGTLIVPSAEQGARESAAPTADTRPSVAPPSRAEGDHDAAPAAASDVYAHAPQTVEPHEPAGTTRATASENALQPKSIVVAQPLLRITRESSPPSSLQEPALPPAPTIRVTIGRILVRATQAPPPRESRAATPAPKLALDDYLKARERGER